MKDIAYDLGLSLVTISKALRGHPDISKKTRERIKARCDELGYSPNLAARSLVTGRSSLVGLIVPGLSHPFFAEVSKGLSLGLREHGYCVVISSSEEDPLLEQQEIKQMLAHRLDALVVASCQLEGGSLQQVHSRGTPVVLIDRSFKGVHSHYIGSDDYTAGRLAAEHLLAMKCNRPAHIRGPENSAGKGRLKGFVETLQKHSIQLSPEYIVEARSVDVSGAKQGADALNVLASLQRPPDGVFCYNDDVAMGVITQAADRGIKIPKELAVIGCGNLPFASALRVPLSSIDQRSAEIGSKTAKLILEIVAADRDDPPRKATKVVLKPRLVERLSSQHRVTRLGSTAASSHGADR